MLQNQNSVTVLMPAYNAGPYIGQAIESILKQTYTDFEFLIINDGSTDNTLSIIQSFNDPRIKLVSRPNKGLIDTLNEGLALAKGEFIARMDSDDICQPHRLQTQVDYLNEHHDIVLVGGEADIIDKDGTFLMKLIPIGYTHEEIKEKVDLRCPFNHPSVMFRKEAVLRAGGYPKNALSFEDHLLWKKLLSIGRVVNLHNVLVQYRFNPESVSVDDKWRGKDFVNIRRRSVENGIVSEEDAITLKHIISSQNFGEYKEAAYYAMIGKKYLWNKPDSKLARANLLKAIRVYHKNFPMYVLYLFSYLPSSLRISLYKLLKKKDV